MQNKGELLQSGLDPHPAAMHGFLTACGLRVMQLVTPQRMAAALLPGRAWSWLAPPLPDFFHYAVAEK